MRALQITLIAVILLGALAPTTKAGMNLTDAEAAINRAITLSQYEEESDTRSLYQLMHPDSRAITHYEAMAGWYRNDFFPLRPHAITEVISIDFITWTWDVTGESYENTALVTFVQPFGAAGNITYTQESVRLVHDSGSWKWFFGRSADFVNEQIQKYPAESESSHGVTRTTRVSSTSNTSSRNDVHGVIVSSVPRNCTLVELYPGYPLYRGNVTGVMGHRQGLGDYQCLEALEKDFPKFDKNREDRRNKTAARDLGIAGEPHQWTWENWLQIEAERGLEPSCYSCLMLDTSAVPYMPDLIPNYEDPRIRLGFLGEVASLNRLLTEWDLAGAKWSLQDYFGNDIYELRAIAYSYDATANATELFDLYDDSISYLLSSGHPFGEVPGFFAVDSSDYLYWVQWETGGYTFVPDNAWPNDQLLLFGLAVYAADNYYTDRMDQTFHLRFNQGVEDWKMDGYDTPISVYFRDRGYLSGY